MSSQMFDSLYQQIILEESKDPQNRISKLSMDQQKDILSLQNLHPDCQVFHEVNPSCGDEVLMSVNVKDSIIKDIKWYGTGCSISLAATSIISSLLIEKNVQESLKLINLFKQFIEGDIDDIDGDLIAFNGVKQFPARIKCALLGALAIQKSLKKNC